MAKKNKKTAATPTNDPVADLFSDLAADTGGSVLDDIDSIKYFVPEIFVLRKSVTSQTQF